MEKPSRKIQSVYRNQNALVRAVFERAGGACKVLRVALDYAKRKHVALIWRRPRRRPQSILSR